ncbi:MAG: hypothetical protein IT557_06945 [Alphaproteobacteria bacterium]|nr:hypothetical protein [Alphaproteobacteria bacterium]
MIARRRFAMLALLGLALAPLSAMAQGTPAGSEQRFQNQQNRIADGISGGGLTPREAARLEGNQARIDRMQDRAASDGTVTAREQRRLNRAQNRNSRAIYRQRHDAQRAPLAASPRLNNQQQRVAAGIRDGSLTPAEAARAERGVARSRAAQRQARADGVVTPRERARVQRNYNRSSRQIHRNRNN